MELNPADNITRVLSPSELTSGHRYQSGPEFLKKIRENWPKNKVNLPPYKKARKRNGQELFKKQHNTLDYMGLIFVSWKAKTGNGNKN